MSLFSLAIVALTLLAMPPDADAETRRLYLVGNSLTDTIAYAQFERMAEQRGGDLIWGRHMIPGAPLDWTWEHGQPRERDGEALAASGFHDDQQADGPSGGFSRALSSHGWDALSLQPFDRHVHSDFDHVARYVNLLKLSPDNVGEDGRVTTQVYLYAHWVPRPSDDSTPAEDDFLPLDFRALWDRPYTGAWDKTTFTRDYFARLLAAVNDPQSEGTVDPGAANDHVLSLPDRVALGDGRTLTIEHPATLLASPVRLLPIGDVLYELEARLAADPESEATYGIDSVEGLYADGVHFNAIGRLLVGTVVYATIVGQSPAGLDPSPYAADGDFDEELVALIQSTAWDVVAGHPHSGVPAQARQP